MTQRQILYSYLDSTLDSFIIMYDWYGIVRRQNDNEMILFPSVAYMYTRRLGQPFPKTCSVPGRCSRMSELKTTSFSTTLLYTRVRSGK